MSPAALAPPLSKEIRALLPLWAACVAAIALAAVSPENGILNGLGLAAYIAGPLAIGAQSIGHEYGYRTLSMLLSQPVDRRRVYLLKFAVSASMLLTIAALGRALLIDTAQMKASWRAAGVQILPVVGGLFVAPWLTMVCRSPLGGIVVATNVAWVSLAVPMAIVALWLGIGAEEAEAMTIGPWTRAMIAFSVLAAVLGMRRFTGLEAIESAWPSLQLPRALGRADRARVYQPLRVLAVKELHLQQLTFALTGLFVLLSIGLSSMQRVIPSWAAVPTGALTLLYCMSLSILIGALASAEERQHGTLEWQLLQPAPAWQQWMVKAAVAFGLAVAFGALLPIVLAQAIPHEGGGLRLSGDLAFMVVLLTACSLYVSSLCTSGVRAMVLSLPVGIGVALFVQLIDVVLRFVALKLVGATSPDILGPARVSEIDPALLEWVGRALTIVLVPLLLRFGFVNHTSVERSFQRIVRQVGSIAAAVAMGMGLASLLLASIQSRG